MIPLLRPVDPSDLKKWINDLDANTRSFLTQAELERASNPPDKIQEIMWCKILQTYIQENLDVKNFMVEFFKHITPKGSAWTRALPAYKMKLTGDADQAKNLSKFADQFEFTDWPTANALMTGVLDYIFWLRRFSYGQTSDIPLTFSVHREIGWVPGHEREFGHHEVPLPIIDSDNEKGFDLAVGPHSFHTGAWNSVARSLNIPLDYRILSVTWPSLIWTVMFDTFVKNFRSSFQLEQPSLSLMVEPHRVSSTYAGQAFFWQYFALQPAYLRRKRNWTIRSKVIAGRSIEEHMDRAVPLLEAFEIPVIPNETVPRLIFLGTQGMREPAFRNYRINSYSGDVDPSYDMTDDNLDIMEEVGNFALALTKSSSPKTQKGRMHEGSPLYFSISF